MRMLFATLRNRNFAALALGGLISLAGDWVLNIGLPIYVFLLTHSFAALSIIAIVEMVPFVVFGSVAGVFVDRWDRKRTLVITNLLLAVGLVPLLLVRSADLVWIVFAVAFVESCFTQFTQPALSAFLPAIVREEHIVTANSVLSINSNLARLGGPALGGLIAGVFGLNGIVGADGVSFLLAALLILTISPRLAAKKAAPAPAGTAVSETAVAAETPQTTAATETTGTAETPEAAKAVEAPETPETAETAEAAEMAEVAQTLATPATAASAESEVAQEAHAVVAIWRDWAGGLGIVLHDPLLRVLFVAVAITALGEGVMGVLYVVYVNVALHGGAQQIGNLMSAQAIGGLAGGLLFGVMGRRVMSRWVIGLAAVCFGAIDLAIFNAPDYYSALVPLASALRPVPLFTFVFGLFIVVGIPGIGIFTGFQSLVQTQVPQAYLGRVFGVLYAFMAILGIVGSALAGIYAPQIGTITMLNIQGGGYIVAGLIVLLFLPRPKGAPQAAPGPSATTEAAEPVSAPAGEQSRE